MIVVCALLAGMFASRPLNAEVAVRSYQGQNVAVEVAQVGSAQDAFLAGVAFMPAIEWPSAQYAVHGFRLNFLIGRHHDVYGLDLGVLGNLVTHERGGGGLACLFNSCERSVGAFDIAGVFNKAYLGFDGLQFAAGLNWTEGVMGGAQVALVNMAGDLAGVQLGVVNVSEKGGGLQVGIVNFSEQLSGVQLGLVNLNMDSSVPMMPLFNCAF